MTIPAHIEATTRTTVIWVCRRCDARMTPGIYSRPEYGEQVFQAWISRHQHQTPTDSTNNT